MKYSININQKALAESKLTLSDAAILDWLFVFCNAKSERIVKNRLDDWTWVSYANLIKDMPLLRIKSKGSLTKRFQVLKDEGYIETRLVKERMYVKMTAKTDTLHFCTVHENEQLADTVQNNEQHRSKKETVTVQNNELISILSNNNTNTSESAEAPTPGNEKVITPKEFSLFFFEEVLKLVNKQDADIDILNLLKEIRERHGMDKVLFWSQIKEFCAYWNEKNPSGTKRKWEMQKTFEVSRRLTTWLNKVNNGSYGSNFISKPKGKTILS